MKLLIEFMLSLQKKSSTTYLTRFTTKGSTIFHTLLFAAHIIEVGVLKAHMIKRKGTRNKSQHDWRISKPSIR